MSKLDLKSQFSATSYDEWKDAAVKLLKGASFEKKLLTKTPEGITLQPIYSKEDIQGLEHLDSMPGMGNLVRSNKVEGHAANAWEVSQELDLSTPSEFNKVALEALKRGQTELNFVLDEAGRLGLNAKDASEGQVGNGGVSISSVKDLETCFEGINLSEVSLFINGRMSNKAVLEMLVEYAEQKGTNPAELKGSVGLDPLGVLAATGELNMSIDEAYKAMKSHVEFANAKTPNVAPIMVCSKPYHNAGCSATQELAYMMATATEYLRKMEGTADINTLCKNIRFVSTVGGNFFMEIAKLRALRLVWSKVATAFGATDAKEAHIHATSAMWNKTVYDPYVNMLRGTTEAFAAAVGGANGMNIAPFDAPIRPSDEFSRRIARNTQLILSEECELTKIIDPAGGSWYIEKLTDEVARKSWEEFQAIEAKGGMFAVLKEGVVQSEVKAVADQKIADLGKRKEVLVGSNMYPNATEELIEFRTPDFKAVKSEMDAVAPTGKTLSERVSELTGSKETVAPLLQRRYAEIYETLRNAVKAYEAKNGNAPVIFQANLGPSRFYRGRADWTAAFFETSGAQIKGDVDFDTVTEAVDAAVASGSKVVVLTSTDDKYEAHAEEFAKALKAKNADLHLIVAGAPNDAYKAAGVNDFVNVRVNNYEMNSELLKLMGVL